MDCLTSPGGTSLEEPMPSSGSIENETRMNFSFTKVSIFQPPIPRGKSSEFHRENFPQTITTKTLNLEYITTPKTVIIKSLDLLSSK